MHRKVFLPSVRVRAGRLSCLQLQQQEQWLGDGADWPGSVFNPDVNIKAGIQVVADNRVRMQQRFPGCTREQYTLLSISEFNSYGSTQSCTVYNSDYGNAVLGAYHRYAAAAGYAELSYP